ncbi:hypothetical protein BpHYR1_032944 [Brachionus plicatilis]|uniref:Uncharacterized protein n=1 Tax=Brachionus plicatilis TaxID=10195 RepID=A0A3M7RPQ7_BRAPC|nr:hypothetical protein BpHYR1_032944 [Brachionus plicatilis]
MKLNFFKNVNSFPRIFQNIMIKKKIQKLNTFDLQNVCLTYSALIYLLSKPFFIFSNRIFPPFIF